MRNNLPVTGKQYDFPQDQTLISVTDPKGRITYCNDNFVVTSGFLREELMGQPHNLVRHPDMPEEAFRDMWETIQSGSPWTGYVKNRRKNGDHYWVRANATPVRDGASILGYLSVRTAVDAEEIQSAERLYATMREEASAGRRITALKRGRVVSNTMLGRLRESLRLGMQSRLVLLSSVPLVASLIAHALGWGLAGIAILGLVALGLTFWGLHSQVIGPLDKLLETANLLAAGDLTQNVNITMTGRMGDLQLAFSQLSVGVRTVVRDVRHEVANIRGGTQEIAAGNNDLSSRTESQASNLEQTAASLEEITGTVRNTAQLAAQAASLASAAADNSRASQAVVVDVASTMDGIADSSRKIGDILQIIEGVAFQTNILALNAAVEAARAGEQGRGFAVVASEVRALAQRTSDAAREVRQLIVSSHERVEAGTEVVAQAKARMSETMDSVSKTATLLAQIQTACSEQELGVTQINQAVSEMDGITQQNAAMVEELAAAAQSLDRQVMQVHNTIRVFKLTARDKTLAEEDAVSLRKQNAAGGAGAQDGATDIDFDGVLNAHQQWRIKLRNAVLRQLTVDADAARRDDCCELGQWIYGPGGQRWGSAPMFTQLVNQHKVFHQEAGKIADLINQRKHKDADRLMSNDQPLMRAGQNLTNLIRQMRDVAQPSGSSGSAALRLGHQDH